MSVTRIKYRNINLDQVRIEEYRIDNVSNPESPQSAILKHTIIGEALVYNFDQPGSEGTSSSEKFTDRLIQVLNSPRGQLLVEIAEGASNATTYRLFNNYIGENIDVDEMHGPFFKANITQITGTNAIFVNFTIEFAKSSDSLNNIRSLLCLASFSIDEMGLTTIRKTGSIQLPSSASFIPGNLKIAPTPVDTVGSPDHATFANRYPGGDGRRNDVIIDFLKSNNITGDQPDYFRRLISGNLERGFRRIRQEYAVDESRTRLLFDITDKEFARGLPAPARVGDCQYSFERSLGENNAIGIKHFLASVKGDRNVTAGALLTLCIRLSQNRIDYKNDLIVKVRVSENNMLTENSITYEVAAKATSSQAYTAGSNGDQGGTAVPIDNSLLLSNILAPLSITQGTSNGQPQEFRFFPSSQPDAYGSATVVRVVPGAYDHQNVTSNLNLPTTLRLGEENPVIYQFPNGVFDTALTDGLDDGINRYIKKGTAAVPTGPNMADVRKAGPQDPANPSPTNPAYVSKGGQRIEVRTGMIVVPSLCLHGGAAVFQMGGPTAVVTDYLDGSRKNDPPKRMLTDKPLTSAISSYGIAVSSGMPDANGNRVLNAAHDRVAIVYPPSDIIEGDPEADPPIAGGSVDNPAYSIATATIDGQEFKYIKFFPNELDLPIDETQGTPGENEHKPSYTSGLGAPEAFA
jgi:hypothetical protein